MRSNPWFTPQSETTSISWSFHMRVTRGFICGQPLRGLEPKNLTKSLRILANWLKTDSKNFWIFSIFLREVLMQSQTLCQPTAYWKFKWRPCKLLISNWSGSPKSISIELWALWHWVSGVVTHMGAEREISIFLVLRGVLPYMVYSKGYRFSVNSFPGKRKKGEALGTRLVFQPFWSLGCRF